MSTKDEINKKYNYRPFKEAPSASIEVANVIDLESIDLSQFKPGPEGLESRKELANQLEASLIKYGFFKVVGHGITEETFNNLKSIAQSSFELPDEEKRKFLAGLYPIEQEKNRILGVVRGTGFKPRGYWTYVKGVQDEVEFLNFRHFLHDEIFFNTPFPEFVKWHLDDVSEYFKYLHLVVLSKILNLIDLILELPEGTLYQSFFKYIPGDIFNSGNGVARLLMYYPTSQEYNFKTNNTWMRGHSDGSGLTFIASQSILSLQIQDHETGKWNFVSHTPNSLIVNIGDALQHLTGGYFKSSIHRVATTPCSSQSEFNRCTIIYFSNPRIDMYIDPESLNSEKLNKLGYVLKPDEDKVTFGQWEQAKGEFFNRKSATQSKGLKLFGRTSIMSIIDKPSSVIETKTDAGQREVS